MSNARKLADNLPSEGQLSGRNIIINGGMTVAQRQVQSTNAGSGYITVDRFYHELKYNTDNFTYTTEQSTDAPSGFSKSLKLTCTTAESALAADEYGRIYYVAEGQDLQRIGYGTSACKEVTLSFYVKSSITGNFSTSIYLAASGGVIANRAYTINSANTWERKELTFPTYTTANVPNTNAAGMYINWGLFSGSNSTTAASTFVSHTGAHLLGGQTANFAGTLNATWQITGVQLEVGSQSTPFEHEPYETTLRKCQRYYAKIEGPIHGYACWSYSNVTSTHFSLPEKMRTIPAVTFTGTNNTGTNDAVTNDTFSLYNHNTWIGTSSGNGTQYGGTSASSTQSIRINTYPHSSFTSNGISAGLYFGQNCSINVDAEL